MLFRFRCGLLPGWATVPKWGSRMATLSRPEYTCDQRSYSSKAGVRGLS